MKGLAVLVPTRQRPHNVRRLVLAFRETAEAPDTVLVLVLDTDDDSDYSEVPCGDREHWITAPGAPMAQQLNHAASIYAPDYRALLVLGDDNVPRTPGWDRAMLAALDEMGGSGFVCANDLISDPPGAHMLMSSDIVLALRWMAEPSMRHYFVDNVWTEFRERLGCFRYLPEVVIEHVHYSTGKVPHDEVYQSSYRKHFQHDEAAFACWQAERRDADLRTVAGVMERNLRRS